MYRGTTPTIVITFPSSIAADNISQLWLTFKQRGQEVLHIGDKNDFSHETGTQTYSLTLTQAQTLSFEPDVDLIAQIRVLMEGGKALASKVMRFRVCDVEKGGEIHA